MRFPIKAISYFLPKKTLREMVDSSLLSTDFPESIAIERNSVNFHYSSYNEPSREIQELGKFDLQRGKNTNLIQAIYLPESDNLSELLMELSVELKNNPPNKKIAHRLAQELIANILVECAKDLAKENQ